jgi:hypothetical protein
MSIRSVACPDCGAAANVPAAMANTRCPACGLVWNIHQPVAPKPDSQPQVSDAAEKMDPSAAIALAALLGGGMLLMVLIGAAVVLLRPSEVTTAGEPIPVAATTEVAASDVDEKTIKPREPEPYREVRLPEQTRKRIYDDYRKVARTTVEKPLLMPQGSPPRKMMEDMLQKTFDRELRRFAALHNIDVDQVHEIIKEGDAKKWDPSPRSNATRGGIRVYPREMSEGWQANPNRR